MAVLIYKLLIFVTIVCLGVSSNVTDIEILVNPPVKILKCFACRGLTLEQCKAVTTKCRPEQNRCLSFLLEGGKGAKYYKRCGRVNECGLANLNKGCAKLRKVVGAANCRPACCNVNHCNDSNKAFVSWVTLVMLLGVLKIIC